MCAIFTDSQYWWWSTKSLVFASVRCKRLKMWKVSFYTVTRISHIIFTSTSVYRMVWMCWKWTDAFYFSATRWAFWWSLWRFSQPVKCVWVWVCVDDIFPHRSLFRFNIMILVDLQFVDLCIMEFVSCLMRRFFDRKEKLLGSHTHNYETTGIVSGTNTNTDEFAIRAHTHTPEYITFNSCRHVYF